MVKKLPIAAALAAMVTAAVLVVASPAGAAPPCSGVGTPIPGGSGTWNGCVYATAGLNARSHHGVGDVTFNDPVIYTYPYRTLVRIDCYFNGPSVNGSTIWDAVELYQVPGNSTVFAWGGAVVSSDAWIYTGSDNPVVPKC